MRRACTSVCSSKSWLKEESHVKSVSYLAKHFDGRWNMLFAGFVPLESHAGALAAALLVGVAVQEAMRLGCWALHRYELQLQLCKAHAWGA